MSEVFGQSGAESGARKRRVGRLTLLISCVVLLENARCTFPDYPILPQPLVSSGAPSAGMSSEAGGSALGGGTLGGGGVAGAGGLPQGGSAIAPSEGGSSDPAAGAGATSEGGEPSAGGMTCVGDQWPVEHCKPGCLRRYPEHCYDGSKGPDEMAVDCGGSCQGCSYEACQQDSDCLSGRCEAKSDGTLACHASLSVTLTPQDVSRYVGTTNFRLNIRNIEPEDGADFALKDLKLRYYLTSSGLVEPLLLQSMQSNLQPATGGSRALSATTWLIDRVESVPDAQYDAYIEVGFADSLRMYPGDAVELYQQLSTGWTGSSSFDQRANYSFKDERDAAWSHVTLFYRDQLIWGLEPRPANPRACFARGLNLDGGALSIAGNDWQGASDAALTSSGTPFTQGGAAYPAAQGELAAMLGSGTRLSVTGGDTLDWTVPDGTYLVYLYAISSGTDGSPSLFSLQGSQPESSAGFRPQLVNNANAWARLGPFRVSVATGKLELTVTRGAISFAGIELWYPD
jgi:hypothetical protein